MEQKLYLAAPVIHFIGLISLVSMLRQWRLIRYYRSSKTSINNCQIKTCKNYFMVVEIGWSTTKSAIL